MKATVSIYDNALFLWHENSIIYGIVVLHVDDFVYCGNNKFHKNVIEVLTIKFKISSRSKNTFKYIGLMIAQTKDGGITVSQSEYIDLFIQN